MKTIAFLALLCVSCVFGQPANWALWDNYENCVPLIEDQGACAIDLSISSLSVLDVAFCYTGITDEVQGLSSYYADYCISGGDCDSISLDDVQDFLLEDGAVTEDCIGDMETFDCPLDECEDGSDPVFYRADDFDIIDDDVTQIQLTIMKYGAVVALLDLSQLEDYSGGIAQCNDEPDVDGAIYLIGWGTNGTMDYWIGANSWGTFWGDQGYVYIDMDIDYDCGITENAYYIEPEDF